MTGQCERDVTVLGVADVVERPVLTAQDWLDILGRSVVNVADVGVGVSYEFRPEGLCVVLQSVAIVEGELRLMADDVPLWGRFRWLVAMWRTVCCCTFDAFLVFVGKPFTYFRHKIWHAKGP